MELLIGAGADVNAKDNELNTPLHLSVLGNTDDKILGNFAFPLFFRPIHDMFSGFHDIFYATTELLVNNDADIYAKNANDEVPLDVAKSERSMRIM